MIRQKTRVRHNIWQNESFFNEHPVYPPRVCSEWARCNASTGSSALSHPFLVLPVPPWRAGRKRGRADTPPAPLVSFVPLSPPLFSLSLSPTPWSILRPRATASKPTSRRTSSSCSKHPWAARWCNFRLETFPARETGNQNEKLKAGWSVGRLDHAEESRCEVSLALYLLTLPEGAGMESIIVPVIALLAWAVIRNRRDWFRGLDKCRGQVQPGFCRLWTNISFVTDSLLLLMSLYFESFL